MIIRLLGLLTILVLAACAGPGVRQRPPLQAAPSVDLARFMGTWHVIAHVPYFFEKNKVATRDGPTVTTLERIGPARVPYQIRNRAGFEGQLTQAGYRIRDNWDIPSLGHVIDTHPELGRSVSRGYLLQRTD